MRRWPSTQMAPPMRKARVQSFTMGEGFSRCLISAAYSCLLMSRVISTDIPPFGESFSQKKDFMLMEGIILPLSTGGDTC